MKWLTYDQIFDLYFGKYAPEDKKVQTYYQIFCGYWKQKGKTDAEIAERWKKRQEDEKKEREARRGRSKGHRRSVQKGT